MFKNILLFIFVFFLTGCFDDPIVERKNVGNLINIDIIKSEWNEQLETSKIETSNGIFFVGGLVSGVKGSNVEFIKTEKNKEKICINGNNYCYEIKYN